MRPESSLAVCDFLGVNFLRLRAAKTDSTCLPGHSRQRRQRSTPRSTARRAQGTLPPSTRSMLPPSSIPGQGLAIAISCDCRLRRGDRAGRRAGDRVSVEGRQVHFISFSFSLKSGEAQKRKKHTKRKKIKNSRSVTTRERSSVQSVRSSIWRGIGGKAKKVTRVGAWCGRAIMRTHLTHGIRHQNPRNTPKQEHPCRIASPTWICKSSPTGVWWVISHIQEYAHARAHKSSYTQKEEQQKQQQQRISRTAKRVGTGEI